MSFHQFRHSFWPQGNFLKRLWCYHDRNPLPPKLNLAMRNLLHRYRVLDIRRKSKKKEFVFGNDHSLEVAERLRLMKRESSAVLLSQAKTEQRFELVHAINETLHTENGAWIPNELTEYYGRGISIEEVALRVRGYLSAYAALKNETYLQRVKAGCEYRSLSQ